MPDVTNSFKIHHKYIEFSFKIFIKHPETVSLAPLEP